MDDSNVFLCQWSYDDKYPSSFFWGGIAFNTNSNGLTNRNSLDEFDYLYQDEWESSIINLAYEAPWYLPAKSELSTFFDSYGNYKTAYISKDGEWWSATAVNATLNKSYSYKTGGIQEQERTSLCRARLCKQIN